MENAMPSSQPRRPLSSLLQRSSVTDLRVSAARGASRQVGSAGAVAAVVAVWSLVAVAGLAATPARAANGDCSQPISSGARPVASDCLFVLRAAVGSEACQLCVCDADGNGSGAATDALVCLRATLDTGIELKCPTCGPTTTTTTLPPGSTTTTYVTTMSTTSSTTSTTQVLCVDDFPCDQLAGNHRCNPFTMRCERPCNSNADCISFFGCDTSDRYCKDLGD
jgi:hypothetical protein